jgi:hypothetical protein
MARYIKANPKVAAFLGLTRDRNTVKDGNYLLWQADMLAFGPLTQLQETLTQIGGLALLAHEAREEQDGTVTRPLPTPTDPRFIIDAAAQEETPENDATGDDNAAQVEEPAQQDESPAEAAEAPASEETDGDPEQGDDNQTDKPENDD